MPEKNITINRGSSFSFSGRTDSGSPAASESGSDEKNGGKQTKITKILDTIITVSMVALFFGLPIFFFAGQTYQGIEFEKQIFFYFWILLATVCWAAKGVILGELSIRRTPLDIPIVIFWVIYALATAFSIDRWHSFWGFFGDPSRGLMNMTALVLAYYLIFNHFDLKRLRIISTSIIFAGAIILVWTTLGILGLKFLPQGILNVSPLSLIGSVSGVGAFCSFLLPFLISYIFIVRADESGKPLRKKILSVVLLLMMVLEVFILLALYNYVPWIGLLIGMGILLMYILSRIVRPSENWTWLPMAVFVIVMAIVMIGGINIARIEMPIEVSPAFNLSWEIAKNAVKDNFILGSGPATYGYDFSLHKPESFNQNYFYNLRFYQGTGIMAEGLATLGILGMIAVLLLVLSYVGVAFYLITREKEKNKIYSLGLLSGFVVLLIYSLLSRVEGSMLILGSLIGMLTLASLLLESETEEKYLNLTLKASPKYALALAFVFMVVAAGVAYLFVYIGKAFIADYYAGSAVKEQQVSEEGSVTKLLKAINLNSRESRYFTRVGQEYAVLANTETLKAEGEKDNDKVVYYLNNSIKASLQGKELMKKDVLAVESLAQVYENGGLYVKDSLMKAEEAYLEAQQLEPNNPNYPLKLGQIKLALAANTEDKDEKKQIIIEAKDLFQKAIDMKNDLAPAYYQLSIANEALGEIDAAIDNIGKAFQFERGNLTYAFNLARLHQLRGNDEDNKMAENLFKQILGINDNEINTHFSLGLLFEKTGRKSDAVSEYRKVIDLLPASPAGGPDNSDDAKQRIEKMIENIQNGSSNLTPEPASENPNLMQETPETQPAPETVPQNNNPEQVPAAQTP